jgi:hypothetical protein
MTRLATQLLHGALDAAPSEHLGSLYHLKAQELGFANGTRISSPRLLEAIRLRYPASVLRRLNATLSREQNWLTTTLGTRRAPIVLGRNLLLFDFFGDGIPTAPDLRLAAEHESDIARRRASLVRQTPLTVETDKRDSVREALLDFTAKHPGAGRKQLLKALGRTAVWAREHDSAWYEETFPSRTKPPVRSEGDRLLRLQLQDERAATYVEKRRRALLVAEGQPKMLTKAVLLRGCRSAGAVTEEALSSTMSRTRQALAHSIETPLQFKRRYAKWLLLTLHNTKDRLTIVERRTGLRLSEIDSLNLQLVFRKKA